MPSSLPPSEAPKRGFRGVRTPLRLGTGSFRGVRTPLGLGKRSCSCIPFGLGGFGACFGRLGPTHGHRHLRPGVGQCQLGIGSVGLEGSDPRLQCQDVSEKFRGVPLVVWEQAARPHQR